MMLTMNSGQYRRQPQINSLPLNFQYAESSGTPMQSTHRMFSFDGLPRAQNDQQYLITPSTVTNLPSNNYSLTTPMALPQASTIWSDPNQTSMNFDDQTSNDYYGYSPSIPGIEQSGDLLRPMNYSNVPRTCFPCDSSMLNDGSLGMDAFDPSMYMIDHKNSMQTPPDPAPQRYESLENSNSFSRLSLSHSPKREIETPTSDHFQFRRLPTPFALPSVEPSEDGRDSSREMTAMEPEDNATDEPYAKLIYRALMSAPNNSMVLQEIYQWFREHTTKGSSDTKGWMNSIRHNLSMNAAFKKTERKMTGDETKKSTEWVLEDFAIKDGVQSTTRYRKGTGAKKFMKTENPAPSRQSSGRKGGISASRTKLQRQTRDRPDPRRSIQRTDVLRNQFNRPRQSSPLTPPTHESVPCNPYFFPKSEPMPYEDMCGLEDVQGVYLGDTGPVFAQNHEGGFADGLPRY